MIIGVGILIICILFLIIAIIKMFQTQDELFEITRKTILEIDEKTKK